MRWDRDPFPETSGSQPVVWFLWSREADQGTWEHMVSWRGHETTSHHSLAFDDVLRIWCHGQLNRIPDEGLPELAESLLRIHEFYETRPPAGRLEPPATRVSLELAGSREREAFSVAED